MNATPTSSSPSPTPSKQWHAKTHHHQSRKGLIRFTIPAPDLRSAEQYAIAKTALLLNTDPTTIRITTLRQLA
jgi:hypothetical protein